VLAGSQLDAAIRSVLSRPFRQTFFRASRLLYSGDPLGRNRAIAENRFNIESGARVLYLSEQMGTCIEEIQAAGFPAFSVAIFPVQLDLKAVVDLRDPATLAALHLTPTGVAFNFRSLPPGAPPTDTQLLGERCSTLGCVDGLLFPSFARRPPTGPNIAIIEATLSVLGSSISVNDPNSNLVDRLP
jgi:RES domain-containing protein